MGYVNSLDRKGFFRGSSGKGSHQHGQHSQVWHDDDAWWHHWCTFDGWSCEAPQVMRWWTCGYVGFQIGFTTWFSTNVPWIHLHFPIQKKYRQIILVVFGVSNDGEPVSISDIMWFVWCLDWTPCVYRVWTFIEVGHMGLHGTPMAYSLPAPMAWNLTNSNYIETIPKLWLPSKGIRLRNWDLPPSFLVISFEIYWNRVIWSAHGCMLSLYAYGI